LNSCHNSLRGSYYEAETPQHSDPAITHSKENPGGLGCVLRADSVFQKAIFI
jgi:hypothetical protein